MREVSRHAQFIGALSTRASGNPAHGHYFWTYKAVHENQAENGLEVPTVIGPQGEPVAFIIPFFARGLDQREFRMSLATPARYRIRKLKKLLYKRTSQGLKDYFLYDGGLSDYWVSYWLAIQLPEIKFTFNFHWADQWIELIRSQKPSAILTRKLLEKSIHQIPKNLRLSAETKVFAKELSKTFDHGFEVFPIFSADAPQKVRSWDDRELDVLFFPQRRSELPFVFEAAKTMAAVGIKTEVALRSETWARWIKPDSDIETMSPVFLPLSKEKYAELLSSSRIVVLPYDKPYFRWGSSGKFNEAIAHGCFPLVPEGSAISSQSSGPAKDHEFRYPFNKLLVKTVSNILRLTPASTLTPVLIDDFLQWMSEPFMSRAQKTGLSTKITQLLLLVAGSTYRRSPGTKLLPRVKRIIKRVRLGRVGRKLPVNSE